MKICQSIDSYFPLLDGPFFVVEHYAEELNKFAECSVVVPSSGAKGYVDKDFVFRCKSGRAPLKYRFALPLLDRKLKNFLKEQNFDLFHLHSPFVMADYILRKAKKLRKPVVFTMHTKYDDDFKRVSRLKFVQKILLKYIMRRINKCDAVWAVNNATIKTLRDYGYKGKVEVVENGTEMVYPDNAHTLCEQARTRYNILKEEKVFLFIGRIVMYKGLKLICESLKILKEQGLKFKFLVVGSGEDEAELLNYAKQCGISDSMVMTGRISDRAELSGCFLAADLFLFPSTFDTSSLTIIEAAAHKLPAVLIRGSSTAEGTEDGVNTFLAEYTPESYSARISEALSDAEHLRTVGENASSQLCRHWDEVVQKAYTKYLDIIKHYNENKQ